LLYSPYLVLQGNALLPPSTTSTDGLAPIHSRLNHEAVKDWKRPDILGVLMASYAMLLRSAPSALASPRTGPVSPPGGIDIRKTWRECLEAPTELKSFTFARLTLLPSLRTLSSRRAVCNVSEFVLTVLADFGAHYSKVLSASGDRPISRAKWEQDAEEDLRLRRSHQEQQRQFHAWSGTSAGSVEMVPAAVDLLQRPDCMDDVVAFAVAVCSLGKEYALPFWSTQDYTVVEDDSPRVCTRLAPSLALLELERQQDEDDTLTPSYLSFLAALALAESPELVQNGAAVVHDMLSRDPGASSKTQIVWPKIVEILRWYVRELSPQQYSGRSSSPTRSSTGVSSGGSTAYYYFGRNVDEPEDLPVQEQATADGGSSRSKTRLLGDWNTFMLLSHLSVISNVAAKCPAARLAILSVNLPILSSDGAEIVGQDSTLVVLFTLAGMPLSPATRGAVFSTIASLLNEDGVGQEETTKMREMGYKAWELLESCQILPIYLLDQYPSLRETDTRNIPGLGFPPSSTALVSCEKSDLKTAAGCST